LERRYVGTIPKVALQFMKDILKMEPGERLTAQEAIMHPYFDGIRTPEMEARLGSLKRTMSQQQNPISKRVPSSGKPSKVRNTNYLKAIRQNTDSKKD
jgi:cyclin-dependent kinase-like